MRILERELVVAAALIFASAFGAGRATGAQGGSVNPAERHESARSDKFTGGRIERTTLTEGQPEIEITVNVPAFQLTLWQDGKEVKTYPIGVGLKDFPIVIGEREASEVIWNPSWIPPDSDWVHEMKGVRPYEVIKASDKRNPLGKLKIPLGHGYLIHEAAKATDLGNLVSHGCVRMLRADLYDLAEKIVAANGWPITKKQIEGAKKTTRTLVAQLGETLPVDINYDTQVIEGGILHLYPDVYNRGTNTVKNLRAELESSGIDTSDINDKTLKTLLARPSKTQEYTVEVASIIAGRALADGRRQPLIRRTTPNGTAQKKRGGR